MHYRQRIELDGQVVELEIVDVSQGPPRTATATATAAATKDPLGWCCPRLPLSRVRASDAVVVMYSITDRASFHAAREALEAMDRANSADGDGEEEAAAEEESGPVEVPVLLLANKLDLSHLRKVNM